MILVRAWKWYQKCLSTHPVKTQIVSSGVLWGIGDIAAQAVTRSSLSSSSSSYSSNLKVSPRDANKHEEFKINWRRVATASMFGVAFVGPVGHHWYNYLDRFIRVGLQLQPKSAKFVATKVAADAIIFGPLDLLVYFSYIGLASGKSVAQVQEDVKRDFLPGLVVGGGVWPIIQISNFRFVPVEYQLLYVNIFCLFDSSFLSWLEQQGDASWKNWFTSLYTIENKKEQN